jgi:uncharacterized lipoprotein YddW (UPF0748 family)
MRRYRWPFGLTLSILLAVTVSPAWSDVGGRPHIPRRALWIETSANLREISSRESIRALVASAAAAGVDTLIPEAKNAWGFVIYESEFAPHIRTSPLARAGYPAPATWYPRDHDALKVLIEEAHAAGLKVHAAINAFGEGLALTPATPMIGTLVRHPEWAAVHLRSGPDGEARFVPSTQVGGIAFVNPVHPEAQAYELAVVWEVVSRYSVDGIVLDRTRYAGPDTDFSDLSRRRFEEFSGRTVARWPDDILRYVNNRVEPGPLYPAWIAWRASVIRAYTRAAARIIRKVRPTASVSMYVGAWYASIHEVGQNWARQDAPQVFNAWSPGWAAASLLPELDFLMVGMYYSAVTRWEAVQRGLFPTTSVVGSGMQSRLLTEGTPLLGTIWLELYRANRRAGAGALTAAVRTTDGLMIFDLSNVRQDDWWGALDPR